MSSVNLISTSGASGEGMVIGVDSTRAPRNVVTTESRVALVEVPLRAEGPPPQGHIAQCESTTRGDVYQERLRPPRVHAHVWPKPPRSKGITTWCMKTNAPGRDEITE